MLLPRLRLEAWCARIRGAGVFCLAAVSALPIIGILNKWEIGMRPETRQTVVNVVMLASALAVVTAIILMRPAARVARPELAAQSAALSAAATHAPAGR
jgi:hypothetical protein